MTTEENVKRYDEALERAKNCLKDGTITNTAKSYIETIFPELKESEDERIRKALIEYFGEQCDMSDWNGVYGYQVLSWLEKQGDKDKFIEKELGCIKGYREKAIKRLEELEKQGEQEPFDYEHSNIQQKDFAPKIEPKFKNGLWIVWKDNYYKVNYNGCGYELVDQNGLSTSIGYRTIDENAHLWDITKDAKDGDVLSDGITIFIFKDLLTDYTVISHCDYNTAYVESEAFCPLTMNLCGKFRPASKEECDLFFSKMKEAGYEWDADKKELKKIELNEWVPKKGDVCKPKKGGNNIFLCDQNGIVFSFVEDMKNGCAGGEISISTLLKDYELVEPKDYNAKDSELQEASYYIPEGFHAEINGNKRIIKKDEQKSQRIISAEAKEAMYDKPDCGKEDERIRKELLVFLDGLSKLGKNTNLDRWTKSDCADWICWIEKQGEQKDKGEISDGYHTFNELYYYRMLYNAAFFNLLPKELVHKSKKHHNGEECFGGGWFIVMANLPTGQISNHYELKDWDMFNIPEKEVADEWDGHTPQDAAERLHRYLLEKQGQKPAYTDEDDRNFSLIYGVLEMEKADTSSTNYKEEIDHAIKWLEKVKRQ